MARATSELLNHLRDGRQSDNAEIPTLAVVIPCYRETASVVDVVAAVPAEVSLIICVDDGCPDGSGRLLQESSDDPRVTVLFNERNLGVGGATIRGYQKALEFDADIVVKLDGDGQMDPALIQTLIEPIAAGIADYTKGNRFFDLEELQSMPKSRLAANAIFSFISKFSTGYWQIFDPTNGFTAIHRSVLRLIPFDKIARGYFFESDMLFRLNTLRGVVVDIPMAAKYGDERSHIRPWQVLGTFVFKHTANFFKRIFYNYFLRGFSIASVQWILGPILLVFGVWFGLSEWAASSRAGVSATAGTVMLAALPTILGVQFLLAAIEYDIRNVPTIPLHRLLSTRRK